MEYVTRLGAPPDGDAVAIMSISGAAASNALMIPVRR